LAGATNQSGVVGAAADFDQASDSAAGGDLR
jgi:hypothetical protein